MWPRRHCNFQSCSVRGGADRLWGCQSVNPSLCSRWTKNTLRIIIIKIFLKYPGGKEMPARGRQRGRMEGSAFQTLALQTVRSLSLQIRPTVRGKAKQFRVQSWKTMHIYHSVLRSCNAMKFSRKVTVSLYRRGNYQKKNLGSATSTSRRCST